MSLVEQAIARMRNQARAAAPKLTDVVSKPAAAAPMADRPANPAAEPAKHMILDVEALRDRGYLPEAGRDRQFADHYRRIKRPLIDKAMSGVEGVGEPLVIMITSALPGDGKTFTSINLALSMALERDVSVLLVDCDVAKRHVSEVVGLKDERGLLDALADESVDIDSLIVQTNQRGLSILPAGRRAEGRVLQRLQFPQRCPYNCGARRFLAELPRRGFDHRLAHADHPRQRRQGDCGYD